jgi:hypothetical protein
MMGLADAPSSSDIGAVTSAAMRAGLEPRAFTQRAWRKASELVRKFRPQVHSLAEHIEQHGDTPPELAVRIVGELKEPEREVVYFI